MRNAIANRVFWIPLYRGKIPQIYPLGSGKSTERPSEPIVFYRYALKKWFRLSQYRWVSKEGMAAGESDRERFRKVVSYERSLYNTNKWVSNVLERHHFLMKSSKRDNISCCDAIETPWLMDAHWPCHMSSISAEWEANLRGVRGEIWCPNWWFQTPSMAFQMP